jgi:PAS domain S-box-containing protein
MMAADDELHRTQDSLEAKTRALAHSEAMLKATLESTTDGILVTDEDGRILSSNQNYAQMTGMSSERMASAHYQDVFDVAARLVRDPEAFQARVAEIVTKSPAETYDVLELVDGRVIDLFSKVLVVEGRRSGRVWSFRDVTERRHADDARRDETRILEIVNETGVTLSSSLDVRTLLQTVTDATTTLSGARFGAFFYNTVDANGDAYMLYTLSGAPREAFEHLGYPRATALFGPTFRGDAPIRCDDVLADPRYGRMGPHHGMPPGHLPVRSYLAVPVVSRSRDVIGGLFFGHPDVGVFTAQSERIVTGIAAQAAVALDNARLYEAAQAAAEERKQLYEREQEARREAERMSDLKDQFLATLSHELRTPLAAILGWAQVLRRGERSQADVHRGLEIIERNARTQTQLIDDLLDMNRIIAGKMQLDVQPVDPVTIIEGALETVRPAAEAKGIRLEKLLDPSTGPVVGDPSRLQQVLWNLLSNAIKFTPKDGKVQAVLRRVGAHVELGVVDTGIGIDPEFLPLVFERFRQADASTTRRYGGLGIGLSIVRQLVELHGGTVRAESSGPGRGASFTVSLPLTAVYRTSPAGALASARSSTAPAADSAGDELDGLTVLVVDDDSDARELVARVLSESRAEVLTAASAAEALPLVERERPDVLVSDIAMPETDGYELLRQVRALGEGRGGKLPAVALTAFARPEDRTRALRAGFLGHVAKPVGSAELVASVAAVARRD